MKDLQKIQKLDAPPFLFTRIEAAIEKVGEEQLSVFKTVSLSFVLAIFLIVNGIAFTTKNTESHSSEINTVYESMNSSNQIYND